MSKLIMATASCASVAVLVLAGGVAWSGQDAPPRTRAKAPGLPRVSSSVEGDKLRINLEVPLDLVVPSTVILRGQGREIEIAIGPRLLRRMQGHTGPVSAVAFSPDGQRILSASGWPWGDRTLRLWDVASGAEIRRFQAARDDSGPATHGPREVPGEVYCLAFTPDGRQALSAGAGGLVQLWDLETGKEIRRFPGHTGTVYDLAISADGHRALTGSRDRTARLWDLSSGREMQCLKGHTGWVRSVAFEFPDCLRAMTGSGPGDPTLRLWNLEKGRELGAFHQDGIVRDLGSVPGPPGSGLWAIAAVNPETHNAPGAIHYWDLNVARDARQFRGHRAAVTSVAFSPDGRQFLSSSYDGTVRLWDIVSGRELYRLADHREWVWTVAYSPRGNLAVSGGGGSGGDQTVAPGHDFALRLWDLSALPEVKKETQ